MIKKRPSFFLVALLFLLLLAWISSPFCLAQLDAKPAVTKDLQDKDKPEKIVAAPRDAREKTGIWVFAVWMWISVFVIVFFLRLKIKEVDRLYGLRFYSTRKN